MSERPYSRVYWTIADDAKFDGIRDDMKVMGAWLTLLVAADMAYPVPAYIPPTVPRSSVRRLVDAGLVDELSGHRYRLHGLESERSMRSQSGRNAAAVRWQSGPNARRGKDEAKPRRDEADASALPDDDGRADLEAFLLVTRRAPTPRQRQLLDGLLDLHDVSGPQWAADIILRNPTDPIGAVIEADRVWRYERIEAAKSVEKPAPAPRRSRSMPESTKELLAHWAKTKEEVA